MGQDLPAAIPDRARLLRIEDTRRDEPVFVDQLLASPDTAARASAALTAGRLGGTAHLAQLRANATDVDPSVAASTLFALGMLRDSSSVAIAARAVFREPRVGVQGARMLGEIGEAGRTPVVYSLAHPGVWRQTRAALLLAAARLHPVPAAAVIPWVASPDSDLAWRAAYALARGRSAAGVRALLAAARSPAGIVREQAARGLSRGLAGDSLGDSALVVLRTLVSDAVPRVRVNAVRSLASYGARARGPVLSALRDGDAGVRLTAAQSLGTVLDSTADWAAAMRADTSFVVQRAVADAAVHSLHSAAVPGSWRTSDDWRRRAAAAELEGAGSGQAALTLATRWLIDADARVRAAALGVVARLADSAETRLAARAILRRHLDDADVQVRATALSALARGANADDLLPALRSYSLSAADRDADARLAFWPLADSAFRRARTLPDSVERAVAALKRPADPLERTVASRIPRFRAWNDPTSPPRPLAWYEQRAHEALMEPPPRVRIETERGTIEVWLFAADAPLTVYNFVSLARSGYFDGQRFHRVVPNFVVQGGDPRGDGNGGPGYAIRDELNPQPYLRGTLGMALSGPDTGGSQFFITHSPQPHLDGAYTVFGQMMAGGDVLDRIVQGDRIVRITIH